MKFPKSMHAEGWDRHVDGGAAAVKTNTPAFNLKRGFKAGAKPVSLHTPLHLDAHPAAAPAVRSAVAQAGTAPVRAGSLGWVVGAGLGALLIGGAVVMSRSLSTSALRSPGAPLVVGQVTPSAEEAQLQRAPPGAGPATEGGPADTAAAPAAAAAEVAPVTKTDAPARTAAVEAPAVKPALADARPAPAPSPPPVWAAKPADALVPVAPAPAPVARALPPQPEVLAQATPSALPAAPASNASDGASPASAVPAAPAVVAQQAPASSPAATPDPLDATITVQVRQALAADAALAAVPIAVSTDHGVVKLEGQAPDAEARQRATVVASNTTGVKAVDNRLTLPPVAAAERGSITQGG
ncbi:MAG: BON domain-containing protein [Burkholderiales bacterium]|nr:MAG: BON domain-containing protein [Burkholderiales bacterium]